MVGIGGQEQSYQRAAGLRVDGGSVAPQDHQVPLASIREMATGMRGNAAFGSLSADLLAIDGRHDGDALGARRLIVRTAADRILEAIDRPTMLIFDDLHDTGIFSWDYLNQLGREQSRRWQAYLDAIAAQGLSRDPA